MTIEDRGPTWTPEKTMVIILFLAVRWDKQPETSPSTSGKPSQIQMAINILLKGQLNLQCSVLTPAG